MKIQCDFCNKDEASVFCSADEAALCHACDHRVHHANKLAGKHHRFSLLPPSPKHLSLCDICQEKRAFLFCQQDRAILCRDCDITIHKANEHTQKHNRFLLTGVELSATSALYSASLSASSASSLNNGCDVVPVFDSQTSVNTAIPNPTSIPKTTTTITESGEKGYRSYQLVNGGLGNGLTSSISEYLIEMLPGWQVEEFLDSSSAPSGFSKTGDNDVLPFWDVDLEGNLSSFSSENMGTWVPQAPPPPLHPYQLYPSSNMEFDGKIGFKDSMEATNINSTREWRDDGCFTVPQISPQSTVSKRSRTFW